MRKQLFVCALLTLPAFAPEAFAQGKGNSASEFAPGRIMRQQGAESAKDFAPGQVKKRQGAQSAHDFAPGQQAGIPGAAGGAQPPVLIPRAPVPHPNGAQPPTHTTQLPTTVYERAAPGMQTPGPKQAADAGKKGRGKGRD